VRLLDIDNHAEHLTDSLFVAGDPHLEVISVLFEELEGVKIFTDREDWAVNVALGEEFLGHDEGGAFSVCNLWVFIYMVVFNIKFILQQVDVQVSLVRVLVGD